MSIPRLEDLEGLDAARVLLRLDLNVPIAGGRVEDDARIVAALPTLRWLLERAPMVAACSHLGKAKGSPDPAYSLRPVAEPLAELLGREVRFVEDCVGPEVRSAGEGLLLLENLRFHPGEKANDPEFARRLTDGFTHYVNDAFGTAHREHASVAAAAALFPSGRRAAGRLMEAELSALRRLVEHPEQPFAAVVGGAKVSTKTAPLMALLERAQRLLIGGGMANTFLLAKGLEVGRSLVESSEIETARRVMARAAERGVDLELPTDLVVADDLDAPRRVEVVAADAIPPDTMAVDIGPATREAFARALGDARTIFWNGPMGVFEKEAFAPGTMAVAEALAASTGFTVVGGGESVMALDRAGVADRIGHVSTGGGASLQLVAGGPLPAVQALEV
ncbi:MAG: phosphoglycerate kinase [Acidobacteria bacterium]|nr:phosphoglycerate kinase [Acidobacteriota bacterium]